MQKEFTVVAIVGEIGKVVGETVEIAIQEGLVDLMKVLTFKEVMGVLSFPTFVLDETGEVVKIMEGLDINNDGDFDTLIRMVDLLGKTDEMMKGYSEYLLGRE